MISSCYSLFWGQKVVFASSILLLKESWKINSCRLMKPKSIWFFSSAIMQTVKGDVFSSCCTYYSQAQLLIREKLDQMRSNQETLERLQRSSFWLLFAPHPEWALWLSVFCKKRNWTSLPQCFRKVWKIFRCHSFLQYFYWITLISIRIMLCQTGKYSPY